MGKGVLYVFKRQIQVKYGRNKEPWKVEHFNSTFFRTPTWPYFLYKFKISIDKCPKFFRASPFAERKLFRRYYLYLHTGKLMLNISSIILFNFYLSSARFPISALNFCNSQYIILSSLYLLTLLNFPLNIIIQNCSILARITSLAS